VIGGCDLIPQRVSMDDERVKVLLRAAARFDRVKYGFTSIPKEALMSLETRRNDGYDAMLHIESKTSRTIAFKKTKAGYAWIGEQEKFEGPNRITTVDGTFNENVTLTYDIVEVSGAPLNRLYISYFGSSERDLSLREAKDLLRKWGY
jgi:hypothetical protein